jgi:hypothetical protein
MSFLFNQAGHGDLGYTFRTQEPRTLEQIDTLLQHQAQLKMQVGPERAEAIEAAPELIADGEKFQKWNFKARNRSIIQLAALAIVGSTLLAP